MTPFDHKPRTYLHFDRPVSATTAEAIATDPKRVAEHAFYPFLGFTITTPRVSRIGRNQLKKKDKDRPIKLAAHLDAAIYGHYGRILAQNYEKDVLVRGVSDCVTAFRKLSGGVRNNIGFAREVFDFIQENRPCVAICLDVEKFFDRLDHEVLRQRWAETLGETRLPQDHFKVFSSLTNFSWVDRESAFAAVGISPHNPKPRNKHRNRICSPKAFRKQIRGSGLVWKNPEAAAKRGIPQGAPISALLSNLYMLDFDATMHRKVSECGGFYRRYCDDIIVVVPQSEAARIEAAAYTEITQLKLAINPSKTTKATFPRDPLMPAVGGDVIQYLGFDFNGTHRLLRASSLGRYYGKMRRGVNLAKQTKKRHNRIEALHGHPLSKLKTRQLYICYSYLIRRRFHSKPTGHERQSENFITYAYRAAELMGAPEIKRQVRNHIKKLRIEIKK